MKNSRLRQKIRDHEDQFRSKIPEGQPIIIRVDGRAFHTLTKGLKKPWDKSFDCGMNEIAYKLAEEVSSAVISYVQSDECTVIATPYTKENTQPWFGGGIQKIASVSASLATIAFNDAFACEYNYGAFDARVFSVPKEDLYQVLFDRQEDGIRNSILTYAQHHIGKKKIHGKNTLQLREELASIGLPWEDLEDKFKYGRMVYKKPTQVKVKGEDKTIIRNKWTMRDALYFRQYPDFLNNLIRQQAEK